jgi:hypothetical protein
VTFKISHIQSDCHTIFNGTLSEGDFRCTRAHAGNKFDISAANDDREEVEVDDEGPVAEE